MVFDSIPSANKSVHIVHPLHPHVCLQIWAYIAFHISQTIIKGIYDIFLGSDQWLPHHIKRFEITLGWNRIRPQFIDIIFYPLSCWENFFFLPSLLAPNFYSLSLILILPPHFFYDSFNFFFCSRYLQK